MQRYIFTLLIASCCTATAFSQPSPVKDTAKKLYKITATDASGRQHDAVAVPVADDQMVCLWSVLKDAVSAVVTNQKDKTYKVEAVMGCDDIYDLCKVRVEGRHEPVALAANALPSGSTVWLSNGNKASSAQQLTVGKHETFADSLSYYNLDGDAMRTAEGVAVVSQSGTVVGLTHLSGTPRAIHSADLRLVASASTNGLSLNQRQFASSQVPVDMPRSLDQARIFLIMAAQQNERDRYSLYIDRFTALFPGVTDGYVAKAGLAVADNRHEEADAQMQMALKNCSGKAEVQYEWAKIVYNKVVFETDSAQSPWTLDDAMKHIDAAIEAGSQSTYVHLKAQILYAQGKTSEAMTLFGSLKDSDIRGSELFYELAQCQSRLGASNDDVLALLDSAIDVAPKPIGTITAPYLLARGRLLYDMERYRQALADYNQYDSLMIGRGTTAEFYYLRHECELKLRQYKPALNDLAHATVMEPDNPAYITSLASLQLRLKLNDDALKTTEIALRAFPEYSAIHVARGLALIRSGNKADGLASLQKAKELGNEQAQSLIDKYGQE